MLRRVLLQFGGLLVILGVAGLIGFLPGLRPSVEAQVYGVTPLPPAPPVVAAIPPAAPAPAPVSVTTPPAPVPAVPVTPPAPPPPAVVPPAPPPPAVVPPVVTPPAPPAVSVEVQPARPAPAPVPAQPVPRALPPAGMGIMQADSAIGSWVLLSLAGMLGLTALGIARLRRTNQLRAQAVESERGSR
jgi:hypothetical protein